MKETLTCSVCNKAWKREKSRGRKPTACPKCIKKTETKTSTPVKRTTVVEEVPTKEKTVISLNSSSDQVIEISEEDKIKIIKAVYNDFYPHQTGYKDFINSTKGGSHWKCNACKKEIVIGVPLVSTPTHRCPPNSTKIKDYERIS